MVPYANQDQVINRQTKVSSHYFRNEKIYDADWKDLSTCRNTMQAFTRSRKQEDSLVIKAQGMSPRAIVIADAASTMFAGSQFKGAYRTFYSSDNRQVETNWSQEESLQVLTPCGTHSHTLTSVQKTNAHSNHRGDCRLDFEHKKTEGKQVPSYIESHAVGSYGWILDKIENIGSTGGEKEIASLLLDHGTVSKQISPRVLEKKLGIANWTVDHDKPFKQMQDLLLKPSNFTTLRPIMQHVANGQETFSNIIGKKGEVSSEEKKFVEEFAPLFMRINSEEDLQKERALAFCLLRSVRPTRRFYPITEGDLKARLIDSSEANIQFLNDLYGLLFIKEISRRQNPGNSDVDLPYALCLIRGLKLIGKKSKDQNGVIKELSFRDVFDGKNGLLFFTRASFLKKNDTGPSKELIKKLNESYALAFPQEAEESMSAKAMMFELSRHFGGASDTDEDSYAVF